MNRPVLTQFGSRKNGTWSILAWQIHSTPGEYPGRQQGQPAQGRRPGSARATYASVLMSNTVLTQIRCCGRAYGACRNGAGMARNRASKIAYFEYFSIYMEKYVKICRNMQQKYAIICKNMDSFCINMQLYVKNMQKYASKICMYMQNMHFICIYM